VVNGLSEIFGVGNIGDPPSLAGESPIHEPCVRETHECLKLPDCLEAHGKGTAENYNYSMSLIVGSAANDEPLANDSNTNKARPKVCGWDGRGENRTPLVCCSIVADTGSDADADRNLMRREPAEIIYKNDG
jgi:hypothetical protein